MSIMQITQSIQIMPPVQFKRKKRNEQLTLPGMEVEQTPAKITNRQIAEVLASIAEMIEKQNGNPYRSQAYRNAARGILALTEPAADILARGEILPVPGLGERLRTRIAELIQIGSMTFQNGFFTETLPDGVRFLMSLDHVGPYTAIRLYEELGIDSPEALWQATQHHRVRQLFGFGPRSELRLQKAAELLLRKRQPALVHGAA